MNIAFDLGDYLLPNDTFPKETNEVGGLVSAIGSNALVIAGIISVIMIVVGGFMFIAGAGQSNPQSAARGKAAITYGVLGFVLVFIAYWVIQGIQILTGVTIFG